MQQGQIVSLGGEPGKERMIRAVAESAYRHGARFVDLSWFDPWVKRARVQYALDDTIEFVPSWYGERMLELGRQRCARIGFSGAVAPGLLDDLDPVRAGRDRLPGLRESGTVINERTTNWTIAPCPTPEWAGLVWPDLEPDAALSQLWDHVAHVCRLDADDPAEAWRARAETLTTAAQRLSERHFEAVRFLGPGTDLTVGLLPSGEWQAAHFSTVDGIRHFPNIPSEEVFSSPDPRRTEGVVRSTKPLVLTDGTIVRDLEISFSGGRAETIEASSGAETLRTICTRDEGAARLGEVALVDGDGRIGALDTVFYDTLLDENAASHVALGSAFPFLVDESEQALLNDSDIHVDFMIGSEAVEVLGVTGGGEQVPVLRAGAWQI